MTVMQIAVIDIVFSLDSVFTAVGLAKDLSIMIAAIVAAILVMMWVSKAVGAFIERHPTIKMLALSFLILIGVALIAEAVHFEIPKGYLYFAMAFSVAVEMINIRLRRLLDSRKKVDEEADGGLAGLALTGPARRRCRDAGGCSCIHRARRSRRR